MKGKRRTSQRSLTQLRSLSTEALGTPKPAGNNAVSAALRPVTDASMLLYYRSRSDHEQECSELQLATIYTKVPSAHGLVPREAGFFAVPLPTQWKLDRDVAMGYCKEGLFDEAGEIFLRICD